MRNTSMLENMVEIDIAEEQTTLHAAELEELTKQKQEILNKLQLAKTKEQQTILEKQKVIKELQIMQQIKTQHSESIEKEAQELENLKKMKEQMHKEYEQQIEIQKEIERQMQEEFERKKQLEQQIETQIATTQVPFTENSHDLEMKEDFYGARISVVSQDKSMSGEYSSFINDIQTVYELQDEDNFTQCDMETVIKNPTPTPDLDESEITVFHNQDGFNQNNFMMAKQESSEDDMDELEQTLMNLVSKNDNSVILKSQKSVKQLKNQKGKKKNISFKKQNLSFSMKSLGSKTLSRKVSTKANQPANGDSPSMLSSPGSSGLKRLNPKKEVIIEQLNSFYSKSEDIEESEQGISEYLNTYTTNQHYMNPVVRLSTSPDQKRAESEERELLEADRSGSGLNCSRGSHSSQKLDGWKGLKRTSTVKEIRKKKLMEAHPRVTHQTQSVADARVVGKKKTRRRKNAQSKRCRDLSLGNQVKYKGSKGFDVIKKYRNKRRGESALYRDQNLGSSKVSESVRSRNKSCEGFFDSVRS